MEDKVSGVNNGLSIQRGKTAMPFLFYAEIIVSPLAGKWRDFWLRIHRYFLLYREGVTALTESEVNRGRGSDSRAARNMPSPIAMFIQYSRDGLLVK